MVSSLQAKDLTALPFQEVQITDDFWSKRIRINRLATIESNLHHCDSTGRIRNFAIAGKLEEGKHQGLLFDDSDVYKVLEGIAYTLSSQPDAALEKRADAIIDKIAAAQQPDGYLNTYYTLVKPKERWKNIRNGHELYCAGHLIEAAVAYHQATGKRKLLGVAIKLADHIDRTFGPDKKVSTSGHEEIELALVKLYRATKQERYWKLAQFFLDMRGRKDLRRLFGEYAQDHKPIREQREVVGHAVRAMYLYCGMADVAGDSGDKELLTALTEIWHDVVDRKMYVTGGIGPSASNEGFTVPYDLPNDSAYAETCAAIGMALWNHRMFLMSGDGKYADVLEREVYNGLLSGVSLSGDCFFYVNPLGSMGRHHRVRWFDCSCCPTNLVRYIPGMGERIWAHRDNAVWTVLYASNTATIPLQDGHVKLTEKTKYPWEGDIEILVEPEKSFAFAVNLRVPGWCRTAAELTVNGEKITAAVERGYVCLSRTWNKGDVIRLSLPMPVERVYADPHVKADVGRVALQRGPIVYCLEGIDNGGKVRNLCLPKEAKLSAKFDKNVLGGVAVVSGEALAVSHVDEKLATKPTTFAAVPYFAWDNRRPGQMIVWLAEDPQRAELPSEEGILANGVYIRASHVNTTDTLESLNDGVVPMSSKDHVVRRMTWWNHLGSTEWLSYRTTKPRKLSGVSVYWFDDTGVGACRVPAEWRLLWLDGDEWKPVKLLKDEEYGTAPDRFNKVSFKPVKTRELRLEVKLKEGYSGGVLKWRVKEAK
ncbi:MAG TPA: beta-L-arabinofuranosidase domain-containing protein [Gemmataceae bacterium]|nr:beta-L-arabinofuranosidase domain-containing protein [Gemmataceae bacterium]